MERSPPPSRPTALIDFPLRPTEADSPRLQHAFGPPLRWLVAQRLVEVAGVLDQAHALAGQGLWVVGLVRFEAAAAFEPAARTHAPDGPPACFAVFAPEAAQPLPAVPAVAADAAWQFDAWCDPLDGPGFARDVQAIHELIRQGEVYQVNLTTRLSSRLQGDALAAFAALRRAQPGGYALWLDLPAVGSHAGETVLSVSPELFFDWRDGRLRCQPMKGTAPRAGDPQADRLAAEQLRASEKERAENLMIVDLLRNDLARIAQTGSVRVPALFELLALPTVWQMTSTIEARPREGIRLSDVFAALFPCGSVTGAPKLRALHHLHRLEPLPRGVYCGALGVIAPGGAATFNVAIRTISLQACDGPEARATCGIGSGITLDATVVGEAAEWRHKQRFLARSAQPFALLESLLLQDGRCWLLQEHLARLQDSAAALGHACPLPAVRQALDEAAAAHPRGRHKARLLLAADGRVTVQTHALAPAAAALAPLRMALAAQPIEAARGADSDFVRHKTTRRDAYAAFAPPAGCFDTLLWNARGELTEFTLGNLALLQDGRWLTPHDAAGLLPGTYRARLLQQAQQAGEGLQCAPLRISDLLTAQGTAFFNSVRGWLPVDLPHLQAQARAQLKA